MEKISGSGLISEPSPDELRASAGGEVTISACVHKLRRMGGMRLMILRTGTYLIQGVYTDDCGGAPDRVRVGAYVRVSGTVKEEPRAEHGFEIVLGSVEILSVPAAEYPLKVSDRVLESTLEVNLEHRSIALRHPLKRAVFRIKEGAVSGFREFMQSQRYTEIHTPKLGKVLAADGSAAFRLRYFGMDAALAQSPQLYKQACTAFFDRVFEVGPAYRAEKHNSARHLNEYIRLDFETSFINDISDLMRTQAAMLRHIMEVLKRCCAEEIRMLEADIPAVDDIPAVTFFEALDILGKDHDRCDLDPTDEMKLCRYARENYGSDFVFVTRFPGIKRPFYVMDLKDDPKLTESFDLLFRGVAIASGGRHIHDYKEQTEKLKRCGIDAGQLETYLDLHKYGMPPHGGAGTGLERFVMKLCGLENIREATLFPRDMHHLDM